MSATQAPGENCPAAVTPDRAAEIEPETRRNILQQEKDEFGGMRFFLAFFGWLTATGLAVLLTAVTTGILAALGTQNNADKTAASASALQTAGVVGIIILAVVLFVSYYAGGYVAGRMARFSGLKQGLAVWLWAVAIAIIVAIVAAIAGSNTGALSQLGNVGLPVSGSTATAAGIISLIVAAVFSLAGAILGGIAGMRFHRRVDRFATRSQ